MEHPNLTWITSTVTTSYLQVKVKKIVGSNGGDGSMGFSAREQIYPNQTDFYKVGITTTSFINWFVVISPGEGLINKELHSQGGDQPRQGEPLQGGDHHDRLVINLFVVISLGQH